MRSLFPALLALALVSGCALETPPVDTARIPYFAFGSNGDADQAAINLSSWAFADSSRTAGNPVIAARAVAAVDYLAGELNTGFRWTALSPIAAMQMLKARQEVRAVMGIPQNAPSQFVVNGLLIAADALAANNVPAAQAALSSPAFSLPPPETLARLAHLPFLPATNIATMNALQAADQVTGFHSFN